jgi:hypothetical protein
VRHALRRVLAWCGAAALTLLLLEGAMRIAARAGWIDTVLPPGADFWWSGHPDFGIWRHPNARFEHESSCFRVVYETNSVGARDGELPRRAEGRRVVVLGDSFFEGWAVSAESRLSSRLEAATGIPHLNFAMAHFSPYQSYLAYRDLAKGFDHDAVLLGLLPANDFLDAELDLAATIPGSYLYRPYLVGDGPDYTRMDHRESGLRRWLRHRSLAANAWIQAASRRRAAASPPALEPPPGQVASWFYDYREPQIARLEAVLRMLAQEAGDRPVGVVLIPVVYDLQRYASAGPAPLAERLRAAVAGTSLTIVDLLPALAESGTPAQEFFLPCDYHWSPLGHAVGARLVQRALAGEIY